MTSVSAGHIILTPTHPVGSGRPQRGSNPGPPHQESRALPTELPRPPPPPPRVRERKRERKRESEREKERVREREKERVRERGRGRERERENSKIATTLMHYIPTNLIAVHLKGFTEGVPFSFPHFVLVSDPWPYLSGVTRVRDLATVRDRRLEVREPTG